MENESKEITRAVTVSQRGCKQLHKRNEKWSSRVLDPRRIRRVSPHAYVVATPTSRQHREKKDTSGKGNFWKHTREVIKNLKITIDIHLEGQVSEEKKTLKSWARSRHWKRDREDKREGSRLWLTVDLRPVVVLLCILASGWDTKTVREIENFFKKSSRKVEKKI